MSIVGKTRIERRIRLLPCEETPRIELPRTWPRRILCSDRGRPCRPGSRDVRIVVAIDPAVTSGEDADETGIIASAHTYLRNFSA
jgi:hypothetical protein